MLKSDLSVSSSAARESDMEKLQPATGGGGFLREHVIRCNFQGQERASTRSTPESHTDTALSAGVCSPCQGKAR